MGLHFYFHLKVRFFEALLEVLLHSSALLDKIDRHRSRSKRKSALLDEIDPWPLNRIVFPEIDQVEVEVAPYRFS